MNRLCRTGAYYTAKLTFSHDFPLQVWGAYYTSVCIIFEFVRYFNNSETLASSGMLQFMPNSDTSVHNHMSSSTWWPQAMWNNRLQWDSEKYRTHTNNNVDMSVSFRKIVFELNEKHNVICNTAKPGGHYYDYYYYYYYYYWTQDKVPLFQKYKKYKIS